jgi:hypothetical protein
MLGASPVDGQIIAKEARIRAMILERATVVAGATEFWYAGVDDRTTKLLVMEGNGDPILIDKVGDDGVCDTAANGREIALDPIKPGGSVPGTVEGGDSEDPPWSSGKCTAAKKPDPNPKTMCSETSELLVAPSQTLDKWPLIYGTNVTGGGLGCTGTSIDIQADGGWVCLVAVASDDVGNVSFSKPIRVCRELHNGSDCPGGNVGDVLVPPSNITCTDGCQLPDSVANYDFSPYVQY